MSRAPRRWRPRHAPSAFTRSVSHGLCCRVARGSRGKRPLVRWNQAAPKERHQGAPRQTPGAVLWAVRAAPANLATALPAPQNCGAVKAGWARKASGLWDGCTWQQHSAPPREYLLVFKDIDMKRAEESSALIQRAHQLHPLEFRLGHRATPAKLSRPNRGDSPLDGEFVSCCGHESGQYGDRPKQQDDRVCVDKKRPYPMRPEYLCKIRASVSPADLVQAVLATFSRVNPRQRTLKRTAA